MTLLTLSILAIIQGITEFLPISSSGHLALFPLLTDQPDQGLTIDVAVHVGTLGAVILYFRKDVMAIGRGLLDLTRQRQTDDSRLATAIILGTIPIIVIGAVLAETGGMAALRNIAVIGWATLFFGIVLYAADMTGATDKDAKDLTLSSALLIGLCQCLAVIPGTSRSGITITAARALGFNRKDAARISMLLSIPTITAAGTLLGLEVYRSGDMALTGDALVAMALAFATGLAAIALFLRWLEKSTMTPFVIYRVILGLGLLWIAYS